MCDGEEDIICVCERERERERELSNIREECDQHVTCDQKRKKRKMKSHKSEKRERKGTENNNRKR